MMAWDWQYVSDRKEIVTKALELEEGCCQLLESQDPASRSAGGLVFMQKTDKPESEPARSIERKWYVHRGQQLHYRQYSSASTHLTITHQGKPPW
jgi:hypothetical protein